MTDGRSEWLVPESWRKRAEPIRGRQTATTTALPGKTKRDTRKAESFSEVAGEFDRSCAQALVPDTVSVPKSIASHYDESGRVRLLAAACAWEMVTTTSSEHELGVWLLEHVIACYGIEFAAECVVLSASVTTRGSGSGHVQTRPWNDLRNFHIDAVHSRIRSLLVALSDEVYSDVAARLTQLRGVTLASDLASSFLLPTQEEWVGSDIEAFSSSQVQDKWSAVWLLACVTSAPAAARIFGIAEHIFQNEQSRDTAVWAIGRYPHLIYSMCANVGPGCEYLVAELFDGNLSAKHKKIMTKLLVEFDTDAALTELISRIDQRYVEPALLDAMVKAPERSARLLAAAEGATAARLLGDLRRRYPKISSPDAPQTDPAPGAALHELPPLLASPPWQESRRRAKPLVLGLSAPFRDLSVSWLPGEHVNWLHKYHVDDTGHYSPPNPNVFLETVANAPAEVADSLLRGEVPTFLWRAEPTLQRILARFDDAAADFVVRVVLSRPALTVRVLMPIDGTDVCGHMLGWLRTKSIRPTAVQWFRRHIDSAADDLVVCALGASGPNRKNAEELLGQLGREGHRDQLLAASRALGGEDAHAEVTQILDTDPLMHLPSRIPTMPEWLAPSLLPPITLDHDARPLPPAAVTNICTMLAMSRLGDEYAGIAIIRNLIAPALLAELTRDIFTRWMGAGCPSQQDWALDALGLVGDDTTVEMLAPLIQTWPLHSAHRRAATGLDVLMAIGSDKALHALWTIADGLRFPALRKKAEANIQHIADELGLSPEDLADRVIPRLGFDEQSTMVVDYGWTSFTVSLTSQLHVVLTNSTGDILPDLPAPTKTDTNDAHDAYKRYTKTRRDLRTCAPDLIDRLEMAMLTERRWTLHAIEQRYLHHPLMWLLTRTLVWVTEDQVLFRFDDLLREPVTATAQPLILDGTSSIRIAHPVEMEGDDAQTWQAVFDDSAMEQPFEQLWRAVFTGEITSKLALFENVKVATRELLGLRRSGWVREEPQDKGAQIALHKPLGGDEVATMMVFPGFNIANTNQWKHQRVVEVRVGESLTPIVKSELVRDLSALKTRPIRPTDTDLIDEFLGFEAST